MDVKVFRNSIWGTLRAGLPVILFALAMAAVVVVGLLHIEASGRAEGRLLLEESIKTSVVRHYAIEGSYPGSISIVEDNYGIHIDRTRYAVFYDVAAPNMMPRITVVELGNQ